jgi:uncharacterized protein (TIGR03083 family)
LVFANAGKSLQNKCTSSFTQYSFVINWLFEENMTTKAFYISALQREAALFASVARQNSALPLLQIPTCPGWNITDLLLHLGRNLRFVDNRLRNRAPGAPPATRKDTGILKLEPQWLEWFLAGKSPGDVPLSPELIKWFEEGAADLAAALTEVESDAPVWNFAGTARIPASFYQHDIPVETALHRWDAQNAIAGQTPDPIEPEAAYAGINVLFSFLPMRRKSFQGPLGSGETYHFHRTDGAGEWVLTFNGNELEITEEHRKGDVAIRGSASDLLLFLWRRIPAERLEVFGDAALVKRFYELLPAI